jgi:hypothetical protein
MQEMMGQRVTEAEEHLNKEAHTTKEDKSLTIIIKDQGKASQIGKIEDLKKTGNLENMYQPILILTIASFMKETLSFTLN